MAGEGVVGLDEALSRVLGALRALPREGVLPAEAVRLPGARGRTLARDVRAPAPVPAFDHAAMDGYALRSKDLRGASAARPRALPVQGTALAGASLAGPLRPGAAARIMTGAALPAGADCVVPFERADAGGGAKAGRGAAAAGGGAAGGGAAGEAGALVRIFFAPKPFENVRRAGEEFAAGAVLVARGTALGPAETGLLAAAGAVAPRCARAPRVAVLACGDEVEVPSRRAPRPPRIRDANGWALLAAAREAGAREGHAGVVPDDERAIAAAIRREVGRGADVVLLSGGAARTGDRDRARAALALLRARPLFTEVALKPGKALGAYILGRGRAARGVFSLPGNPVAALVGFLALVRPALLALQGRAAVTLPEVRVPLPWAHEERPGRTNLLRVRLAPAPPPGYGLAVAERLPEGSAMLGALARANALLRLEGSTPRGGIVRAILLPGVS